MNKVVTLKNGQKVVLRAPGAGDEEEFNKLAKKVGEESFFTRQYAGQPNKDPAKTLAAWQDPHKFFIGAFDADLMVGQASLYWNLPTHPRHKHVAGFAMFIRKAYAGLGLGNIFMQHLIAKAQELGVHRLEGDVYEKNLAAIALYKKYGFEIEGLKRDSAFAHGAWHNIYMISKLFAEKEK